MLQLIATDEYGQRSIEASGDDVAALVAKAKEIVDGRNVDNALTVYDKKRNWEAFFVELLNEDGKVLEDGFYGGRDGAGRHIVLSLAKEEMVPMDSVDVNLRVYLGNLDKEDWYAEDERGNLIEDLTHRDLEGKTVLFIRKA